MKRVTKRPHKRSSRLREAMILNCEEERVLKWTKARNGDATMY